MTVEGSATYQTPSPRLRDCLRRQDGKTVRARGMGGQDQNKPDRATALMNSRKLPKQDLKKIRSVNMEGESVHKSSSLTKKLWTVTDS